MNQVIVFPGFYSAIVVCDPSECGEPTSSPGLIPPALRAWQKGLFWKEQFHSHYVAYNGLQVSSRTVKSLQQEQGQEQKGKTERVQTCWEPGIRGKKKQ